MEWEGYPRGMEGYEFTICFIPSPFSATFSVGFYVQVRVTSLCPGDMEAARILYLKVTTKQVICLSMERYIVTRCFYWDLFIDRIFCLIFFSNSLMSKQN